MTMSASIPADDTGHHPALAGYAPASTGERILGYLLDAVVGGVIGFIAFVPLFAALLSVGGSSSSDEVGGALSIGLVGAIAVNVVFCVLALYVLFAKGSRVGAILLGLQNVDVQTGRVSGGKTFLKYLLQSLVIGLTLGLGAILLVATIRPGLGRNWFDRATGVVVINNRRGRKPGAPAAETATGVPERMPPPAIQQVAFPGSASPFGQGAPAIGAPGGVASGGMPLPSAPQPAPVSPLDSWQPATRPSAPAPSNTPFAPSPPNSPFAPPSAGGFPGTSAPSASPHSPSPSEVFPGAPVAPAFDVGYVAQPAAPSFPNALDFGVPAPTPTFAEPAPLVRDMRPPQEPVSAPVAGGGNELDRTLARSFTTVRIRVDNGEVLDIDTPVLLGRNPGQLPGFESARLIPVADLARSISKTHLAVGPDGAGVWVEDLNSMNGVRVTVPGGAPTKAIVGQRYPVPPGGRVEFGDRSFVVVAG